MKAIAVVEVAAANPAAREKAAAPKWRVHRHVQARVRQALNV